MPAGEAFPTTEDCFLGRRLTIRQPAGGYRAGADPVFMAASVSARDGDRVLDLGCGVGTASLCLLARLPSLHVTGLELQPELADLARANAVLNHLGDHFTVVEGCLTDPPALIRGQGFDHVITNPPWYEQGSIRPPQSKTKAVGHVEGDADLDTWTKVAVGFLKPKGRLIMLHRADRLGDMLAALKNCRVGEIKVLPLLPRADKAAIRVIVMARRGVGAPLEILPPLVLHGADGAYTSMAENVLRHGGALF